MRRTIFISQSRFVIVLLTILAGIGISRACRASDDTGPPSQALASGQRGNVLVVPIGTTQRLQMKGKKVIQSVTNPKDNVAVVQPVEGDPRTVLITGREAGMTRVTLT